jgi:hypothetical protein
MSVMVMGFQISYSDWAGRPDMVSGKVSGCCSKSVEVHRDQDTAGGMHGQVLVCQGCRSEIEASELVDGEGGAQ